jgi:hypothetical protein
VAHTLRAHGPPQISELLPVQLVLQFVEDWLGRLSLQKHWLPSSVPAYLFAACWHAAMQLSVVLLASPHETT